ncbi:MAG: bifunctional proline dehydrogenase/L-glutamate gamma-semialdehyde dehydrogenase PutA [Caulobacterales bacterium]|nr:bifunctional proline dehydrogenase/L-glutamate gamma-semialdehyde dehydrogenase PutA [Caulobacterales bacterium]
MSQASERALNAAPPIDRSPGREGVRALTLAGEAGLVRDLAAAARFSPDAAARVQDEAARLVALARARAASGGLVASLLQEYGLSTEEGIALMRLAEAMLRTPDAATVDALIRDKVADADWASHDGQSASRLVNISTRGLMATAAWLDEIEPGGNVLRAARRIVQDMGEPVIRTAVRRAMRILGEHFVLGETIEAALRRAEDFAADGYVFSYDMLGEAARTAADAERYVAAYAAAIAAISASARHDEVRRNPGVSVKLSALHPRYEFAQRDRVLGELLPRIAQLARAAKAGGIGLNIDAEEADRLEPSLDIIDALLADETLAGWEGLGVVVQAYQRRAPAMIAWLADRAEAAGRRVMVRLVKGAYWDSEIKRAQELGLASYPVFTRKENTDASFLACAKQILERRDVFYPQIATHNAYAVAAALELARGTEGFEFQRLHGMGEALHDAVLADHGAVSRIYAPVGSHRDLLPYLVRRLLENGANSSFVHQLHDPSIAIEEITRDPVDEALSHDPIANPAIPAPRDILGPERRTAEGADLTDPAVVFPLCEALRTDAPPPTAAPVIAGQRAAGEPAPVRDPADRARLVGHVVETGAEEVKTAVAAAADAMTGWSTTGAAARADVLRRAADLFEADRAALMRLAVRQAGKTLPDAIAEVREAVDFLRYYAARAGDPEMGGRVPHGPVVAISPWNFPLAIFTGQVAAALAAGNTVLAKPAEQTPLIAARAVERLHAAGVPAEALHLLPGDGARVGGALVSHPRTAGVVFTGSTETARLIQRALCEAGKSEAPFIAETGGVNAMIVDSTALLEQAVRDAVASAFQSAGQRCSALRLLLVQADVADAALAMLAGAMAELRLGDPMDLATDIGPVIDEEARDGLEAHIAVMERSARLIARAPAPKCGEGGLFVRPVAFEIGRIEDLAREVFGPVLHVARYASRDLDRVIDAVNARGYGLTMGLHSRIDEVVERVAARAHVGNLYVNRNQIGAVVGVQPFGGEGLSGTGPKAGGPHYLLRLSRPENAPRPARNAAASPASESRSDLSGAIAAARRAQRAWGSRADRAGVLEAAGLARAARLSREVFDRPRDLPGPTGERNGLFLAARGLILCLGDGEGDRASALAQAELALAAGDAVLMSPASLAEEWERKLAAAGAAGLLCALPEGAGLAATFLREAAIDGVAISRASPYRAALAAALAEREGAILPLLAEDDDPYRFAVERTLTVNTAAAGGDVRLLALDG